MVDFLIFFFYIFSFYHHLSFSHFFFSFIGDDMMEEILKEMPNYEIEGLID